MSICQEYVENCCVFLVMYYTIIYYAYSDVASQSTKRRGHISRCRLACLILLALSLFFIGVAAGLLIGKLVFDKEDDKNGDQTSSANWGGMVTQGGVQKPVLEAIVDMMKAENIKENLR